MNDEIKRQFKDVVWRSFCHHFGDFDELETIVEEAADKAEAIGILATPPASPAPCEEIRVGSISDSDMEDAAKAYAAENKDSFEKWQAKKRASPPPSTPATPEGLELPPGPGFWTRDGVMYMVSMTDSHGRGELYATRIGDDGYPVVAKRESVRSGWLPATADSQADLTALRAELAAAKKKIADDGVFYGDILNRVGRLLKNHPGVGVPESAVCFFQDGNKWCCVFGDFINLQESPAGFGDTFEEAMDALKKEPTR